MADYTQLVQQYHKAHGALSEEQKAKLKDLAINGQYPKVMLITCADSRIEPHLIMEADPGDLFTIRHVANWVPPYTDPNSNQHPEVFNLSASLEFAIGNLKVEHIVVMGHQSCGGVAAMLDGAGQGDASCCQQWLSTMHPIKEIIENQYGHLQGAEKQQQAEYQVVASSLQNLEAYPFVKQAMQAGNLSLHGWHYHIESGNLTGIDKNANAISLEDA